MNTFASNPWTSLAVLASCPPNNVNVTTAEVDAVLAKSVESNRND